ncbi:MFS transporter [Chitinophaga agrisoli]|uniref:MFS transporter n=1 Tax=Chitinophaga agrisoli TaxID=2607653 RepID=A0A5B2VKU0_9BACT|nr:MFS transporter [Chitinophaga agrisoli]KAA2239230.1 MFS transporter [Chitinophaga agrisoli]
MTNKPGHYRWAICSLLFFATTINYLDRQVVGYLKPILEKQFNWTETDYSHIVMAFTAAYAVGLLLFGRIIDKLGSKMGYTISIAVWSIAAMLHAVVKTTLGFGIVRATLGLGESGNFPSAIKTVVAWFPKKERALATGFFDSGANIGAVLAPVIIPWLLGVYGWQAAFMITGGLGLLWLMAWLFMYNVPDKHKQLSAAELAYIKSDDDQSEAAKPGLPWFKLFGLKQTWAFIIGKFFTDPIWYFFMYWLPSYFSSAFHLDLKKPTPPLIIIYTAATLGALGGGYLSSTLIKKGWAVYKARKYALLISALVVLPIFASRYTQDIWVVVGLISLSIAGNAAWSANIYTIVSDMLPSKAVSSVIGIGGMAGAIGGVLFPIGIGAVLDHYKALNNITAGYNIIFIFCSLSFLLAWLLIHFLTPKMEPVDF